MNSTVKTIFFWLVIGISASLLWQIVRSNPSNAQGQEISYSTFITQAEAGQIARVDIAGARIEGEYRDGKGRFRLTGPSNPSAFLGILQDMGVEIRFRDVQKSSLPLQLLGTWAPLILLAAIWVFMIRQMRGRSNPPRNVGGDLGPSGGIG
jgi:cell division protease FtsH